MVFDEAKPIYLGGDYSAEAQVRLTRKGSPAYNSALKLVMDEHAQWLRSNGREGTRLNLSRQDLAGANLEHVRLDGAELNGSSLYRALLSECNFRKSNFFESKFTDAEMAGTDFTGARTVNADFPKAQISPRGLLNAKIRGWTLTKLPGGSGQER